MLRRMAAFLLFAVSLSAQGIITTIAGSTPVYKKQTGAAASAAFGTPQGLAFSGTTLYFSDTFTNVVYAVDTNGNLTVVAGLGFPGAAGDNGPATSALLNNPTSLAFDSVSGDLFIADTTNNRIRKILGNGTIVNYAGNGGSNGSSGDGGAATAAGLGNPTGLTFDTSGNLYFADNFGTRVRMVSTSGTISTVAGSSNNGTPGYTGDGGPATSATFNGISGLAFDPTTGMIYVADQNNNVVRRFKVGGTVTTVAGNGTQGYGGDGGPGTKAQLSQPQSVSVDPSGNVFIVDNGNSVVRFLTVAGNISTVAGNGTGILGYITDGLPATTEGLSNPTTVFADPGGNGKAFIADAGSGRILQITKSQTITTLAGNGQFFYGGDGGPATSAFLTSPFAVTVDAAGNTYIADFADHRVRKMDTSGNITTILGTGVATSTGDGGPATSATIGYPTGVAVDASGNIYVSELVGNKIRKITNGTVSTFAGTGSLGFAGDGGKATAALLAYPAYVALDGAGNLYFLDYVNMRIREVSTAGTISTVAGNGSKTSSGDGGPATSAGMSPNGFAVSSAGVIFISDGSKVRKVSGGIITTYFTAPDSSTKFQGLALDSAGDGIACFKSNGAAEVGIVTPALKASILAGNGSQGFGGDGGPATAAGLSCQSVAVDNSGNVLVADGNNSRVRKVFIAPPTITPGATSLTFTTTEGVAPTPQRLDLSGTAGAVVQATWTSTGGWLNVSPGFTQLPGPMAVNVFSAGLTAGTYQGTITLQDGGATSTVNVTLTVNPASAGSLTASPAALQFVTGTGTSRNILVGVTGSTSVPFSVTFNTFNGGNWLNVTPASGTALLHTPVELTATFTPSNLSAGVYTGQVVVSGGGQTVTVPVRFDVLPGGVPVMNLLRTGFLVTTAQGSGLQVRGTSVNNAGSGPLPWTATVLSGANWLTLAESSGTAPSNGASALNFYINPGSLTPGAYYALVQVSSSATNAVNAPQYVTAVLNVVSSPPAGALVYPSAVLLNAFGSNSTGQNVGLYTGSGAPVQVAINSFVNGGANWQIQASPQNFFNGGPNASLTIAPDAAVQFSASVGNLTPGVYNGVATATFLDGSLSQDIRVTLLVPNNNGNGNCTPTRVAMAVRHPGQGFAFTQGWPAPMEVQLGNDCGGSVNNSTVIATFNNGDPPLPLIQLSNGIYGAMYKPGSAGPVGITFSFCANCVTPQTFTVNGTIAPLPAGVPTIGLGGVVNGASFAPGADVGAGSIISIFGANLGSAAAPGVGNGGFPLPTTLGGVKLSVAGQDAPLFFSYTGQVNGQLPFQAAPGSQTSMVARNIGANGVEIDSVPEAITVSAARPGIFIAGETNAPSQGAILNPANAVVDAANPSSVGGVIVIFCTGLGQATPALTTGTAAAAGQVTSTVSATIGGVAVPAANIQYAGPAPGFVGLYQVNVQIPSGVPSGPTVSVVLSQNGISSNTATIAIK